MYEKPKMTFYREEKMGPTFEFEDSDAFFSMRGPFWEESREKALAEKRASNTLRGPRGGRLGNQSGCSGASNARSRPGLLRVDFSQRSSG